MTEGDVCEVSPMNKDWMGVAMHVGQACYSYRPDSVSHTDEDVWESQGLHCTHLVSSEVAAEQLLCCMFCAAVKIAWSIPCSHANVKARHGCCQPS